MLTVLNHDRDVSGMTYVYPVVSRRARGVSLGINLNPNNACNFRCIYCQVPGLVSGNAPAIDLVQLRRELAFMLRELVVGDYLQKNVPEGMRRLNDVAFSGNGEPTTCKSFDLVVEAVEEELARVNLPREFRRILITNGSCTDRPHVERGLHLLADKGGEVWFKLDSATEDGARLINSSSASVPDRIRRLVRVAQICPTWIQTCLFMVDGAPPSDRELTAYLQMLDQIRASSVPLRGVLLYGLARASHQPEAPRLTALSAEWMEDFAQRIRAQGTEVQVTP